MKEQIIRLRIQYDIYKRFKHICIDKDLSVPKQTEALILTFVQMQEETKQRLEDSKKYNELLRKNDGKRS